ncbi:MAG: hypothetical protein RLZZ548_201, partial [Bacteroidota bacterium]
CFLGVVCAPLSQSGAIADDQNDVFWGFGLLGFCKNEVGGR